MTGTFKANIPYNNFLLLLYGFLLKLPMFINPITPVAQQSDGFFYKALLSWLKPAGLFFPYIYPLIAFLLLYTQAVAFNKLVNNQRLLPKPNYLTGMSYLLVTSIFPGWYGLFPTLLISSLLIWVLSGLCSLHNNPDSKTALFNAAMITGLATFIYFPSIIFLLLVLTGLAITRTFKLPEWILVFMGILTPYYFLWAWVFLTGNNQIELMPTFALSIPLLPQTTWSYSAILFILITATVGIIFIQNSMRRLLVQSRKSWSIIYLFLLIALIVPFLNPVPGFSYWFLTTLPLASLFAAAFYYPDRKWFPFVMHWGMVILTFIMGYNYVMN